MKPTRFEKFSWIIATVFGAGNIPEWLSCRYPEWFWWVRPGAGAGTIASLLTFGLVQIPMVLCGATVEMAIGTAMVSFIIGLVIVGPADNYIRKTEGRQLRHDGIMTDHDFNQNCWDEVVGQLVAGIPVFWFRDVFGAFEVSFLTMLGLLGNSFFVFRFFDITKWFGIKWIEKSLGKNAFGILWDDVAAAVYAWFVVWATIGLKYGFNSCLQMPIFPVYAGLMIVFVFIVAGSLPDPEDHP